MRKMHELCMGMVKKEAFGKFGKRIKEKDKAIAPVTLWKGKNRRTAKKIPGLIDTVSIVL